MNKAIVVMVMMCLVAAQAGAGWFSSNKFVDFDALDKWAAKNSLDKDDVDANLEFIKNNLDQLKDKKARRAAEIVLAIAQEDECTVELMEAFEQVAEDKVALKANSRIGAILEPALERLSDVCGKHIDETVDHIYQTNLMSDANTRFLEVVALKPNGWKLPIGSELSREPNEDFCWYTGNVKQTRWNTDERVWASRIHKLAANDKKARVNTYRVVPFTRGQEYDTMVDQPAFFDTRWEHIFMPCRAVVHNLGKTFAALSGYLALKCSDNKPCYKEFLTKRSAGVPPLLYAYKECKMLPTQSNSEIVRHYSQIEKVLYGP